MFVGFNQTWTGVLCYYTCLFTFLYILKLEIYKLFTPSLPCFKVNMIQVLGSNEVNKGFSNIARVIFTHLSLVTCNATSEHWHDSTCTRSKQRLLLWKSYRSSNKQHWLLTARSRMHWELNILYHLRNARTNVHVL